MWASIMRAAVRLALYAANHPKEVSFEVARAKAALDQVKKAAK